MKYDYVTENSLHSLTSGNIIINFVCSDAKEHFYDPSAPDDDPVFI